MQMGNPALILLRPLPWYEPCGGTFPCEDLVTAWCKRASQQPVDIICCPIMLHCGDMANHLPWTWAYGGGYTNSSRRCLRLNGQDSAATIGLM